MTIIVRNGKYINTDTPDANKQEEMRKLGERVTKANREIDHKKKSTLLLKRALTVLDPMAKGWPGRQDLQDTVAVVKEAIDKNHLNNHTKTFVNILDTLENIIPLMKMSKNRPTVVRLQRDIVTQNQDKREKEKVHEELPASHVKNQKSHLTVGDIDRWIQTSSKGDRLIYYTGHTFDKRQGDAKEVFNYVRDLCFKFEPIATNKKYIKTHSSNEWGVKYHGIINLFQKKVVPEQKDKDKHVISHAIYNYIMEKL
jgi:hypothetical protein